MKRYSVFQKHKARGNMTWYGRIAEDGLFHVVSLGTKKKADAIAWLDMMNAQKFLPEGFVKEKPDVNLVELSRKFIDSCETANNASFATMRAYQLRISTTRTNERRPATRKSRKNATNATTTAKKAESRNADAPHAGSRSQARRKSSESRVKPGTKPTAKRKSRRQENGAKIIQDIVRNARKNVAHGSRKTTRRSTQKSLSASTSTTATHKRNTLESTKIIKTSGSPSSRKNTE